MQTFEENKPAQVEKPKVKNRKNNYYTSPWLNECINCKRKSGESGVTLYNDVRGYKLCNYCKAEGHLMQERKLSKKDKKAQRLLRDQMRDIAGIKHITLTAKGEVVK